MKPIDVIKSAWGKEYARKGIPSSFRKNPSNTVLEFINWLKKQRNTTGAAADIGCGLGRNSFYLASEGYYVTGIDLIEKNVDSVNEVAKKNHLSVQAFAQDAANDWPIASTSLDVVIDVFCYKHITDKVKQKKYRQELWRTLKPHGFYFISLASENDGFYGPLLKNSKNAKEKLIIDPYSNIPSFLYSMEDLKKEFSDYFELVEIHEKASSSPMYEVEYPRLVINAVFTKVSMPCTRKIKSIQ